MCHLSVYLCHAFSLVSNSIMYLIMHVLDPLDPSHYCLGIRPTGPGGFLIIGDTIMERFYVIFDNVHNQIGWAPVNKKNCGSIPL